MTTSTANTSTKDKIKIMLVDDSVVIRGFISRIIDTAPDEMEVISSVQNGQLAINSLGRQNPDIIILDIEMPVMDGITALPKILEARPNTKVIMCSTLTKRNADITLKAMSLGAIDCIAKPSSSIEIRSSQDFHSTLLRMIRQIGKKRTPINKVAPIATPQNNNIVNTKFNNKNYKLNNELSILPKPQIITVGSSTGGPQALFTLLKNFKGINVPIIITQHMPATFTKILAQHIEQQTTIPSFEAEEGMEILPGKIYVAAGGYHMTIKRENGKVVIRLNQNTEENYCRPSVDPMVRSAIEIYGKNILGVMLTGMGNDGLNGFKSLTKAGGFCIAQDEKTSVVWGMPGAVAMAGICRQVLPLNEVGPWVKSKL